MYNYLHINIYSILKIGYNAARKYIRSNSVRETEGLIKTSLQSCRLEDNACLRQCFKPLKPTIQGLQAVLQHLLCLQPIKDMHQMRSHMPFNEAFEIFNSFHENMGFSSSEKQHFLTSLPHPTHGLRILVVQDCAARERHIVLWPNEVDIEDFIKTLLCKSESVNHKKSKELEAQESAEVTSAMDTEWDRKCLKTVLGHNLSRKKLKDLGLNHQATRTSMKQVKESLVEMQNTKIAAEDMLMIRLEDKAQRLEKELTEKKQLLVKKQDVWPSHEITALERSISIFALRINENKEIMNHETSASQKKFYNMKYRLASGLIEHDHTRRRSLGSGRRALSMMNAKITLLNALKKKHLLIDVIWRYHTLHW